MKILRLTPHFYYTPDVVSKWIVHLDQIGGMQTQIFRQSIYLSQKNVHQIVLPIGMPETPKTWNINSNLVVIKSNAPMLPIKSKVRGTVGINIYWGLGTFFSMLKQKKNKNEVDIIHTHCSGVATPLTIGAIAKWIFKKPLVYTVHCCRVGTYHPMSKYDAFINNIIIKTEKYCLKKADAIIALTPKTKKNIESNYGIESNKIYVIPDVIDSDKFLVNLNISNQNEFNKKHNIDSTKKNIAFIGRIAHEKGWRVLYDAFKQMGDDSYNLIFFGDGNNRKELETFIKNDKLNNRCRITGYLPNDQISLAINSADVIVMPSLHEEFGGLILEIAAVGKALIASCVGGIPELIADGYSGVIFQSENVEELTVAIKRVLSDSSLKINLGKNLKNSMKKYNINECMDDMIRIYEKLMDNPYSDAVTSVAGETKLS